MKKSKFSEEQISYILKQAELGTPVAEVCRKVGVTEQTYYRWKNKYGGMLPSDIKRLRQLEEENEAFLIKRTLQSWVFSLIRMIAPDSNLSSYFPIISAFEVRRG